MASYCINSPKAIYLLSQKNCMFKYCVWGIIVIFFGMMTYIVFVPRLVNILTLFMMSRLPQSFWVNFIVLGSDLTWFNMYIYISNKFFHTQLCRNEYFALNYYSAKGDNFSVSLIFSEGKIRDRAPMMYLFYWWGLRRLAL